MPADVCKGIAKGVVGAGAMAALHALEERVPEGVGVVLAAAGGNIGDGADFEAEAQVSP